MLEIIWHGRGGQGVVVASSILGTAIAIYEGRLALSIPGFGGQRRDAPVIAVTRISDSPIRRRDLKADPDYIVVFDDSLISVAVSGLKANKPRHLIVNSTKSAAELNLSQWKTLTIVDAATIATQVIGNPIVNTVMLGVLAAATGLATFDSVKKAIADVVPAEIREKNITGAAAGFKAVSI